MTPEDQSPASTAAGLDHEQYRLIVAPALESAADTAARRGDPWLYNDMASMLALMALVTGLATCYHEDSGADEALARRLEQAPLAACGMVFTETELTQAQVDDCIWALRKAYSTLRGDQVIGEESESVTTAWKALRDGRRDNALEALKSLSRDIARAVDDWEAHREASA
ncbi:MAG: hypothetical protein PVJ40_10585 [Gammaproteobacteria bacterium]|jgi:hypothetical protein